MDPIYRKFMIRRIASARQKSCYIEICKRIVDNKATTRSIVMASSLICRLCLTRWCDRSTRSSRGASNARQPAVWNYRRRRSFWRT